MEEKKNVGLMHEMLDLSLGEAHVINLVKMMDGDAPLTRLEIVRRHNEPRPDEPKRPIGRKEFYLFDDDSFIRFVKRYGDAEKSLIIYDTTRAVMLFDATQEENWDAVYDIAVMKITPHSIYSAWERNMNRKMEHRQMFEFLRTNVQDIVDGDKFILQWSKIKTTAGLVRDVSLDDGYFANFSFKSKTESGTQHGKLPCKFGLRIPVLESNENDIVVFQVDIDIYEPKNPDDEALFSFRCREFDLALKNAVKNSMEFIRDQLPEFTILFGDTTHTSALDLPF